MDRQRLFVADLELRNQFAHAGSLGTQLFATGGHLFAASSRLLGNGRDGLNGVGHFRSVGCLFDGGFRDLSDLVGRPFDT